MKKIFLATLFVAFALQFSFGQAVKDRAVIPVAVNLNQVLRLTIQDGGNIEFTFNTIDQYKLGISGLTGVGNTTMYTTNFTVASSTRWELNYGSETATFIGTDNPANTLALDNVGFDLTSNGSNALGTHILSAPTTDGTLVADLDVYPIALMTDGGDAQASAGDETDNDFTMLWRCGTFEGGMNAVSLIDQVISPTADRYVANVIFELSAL